MGKAFLLLLALIPALLFTFNDAHAFMSITLTNPSPNAQIIGNSLDINGTWEDTNSSSIPTISAGVVDQGLVTATVSGNTFGVSISGLTSGNHTVQATITDQIGSTSDRFQIEIVAGHIVQSKLNLILLKESNTCEVLLKENIPSGCPTLNQLAPFDTSDHRYTGKIIQTDSGQWIRTKPVISQWWNFINATGKPVVCVECDFDYAQVARTQIVFIQPVSFAFASLDPVPERNVTETYWNGTEYLTRSITDTSPPSITLNVNHNRYYSPDCMESDIAFSPILINDTINFLESGCTKTKLILTTTLTGASVPFDFAHSNWYHEQVWLNNVTASIASQDCQEGCKDIARDPYHTVDPKFGWN